MTKVNCKGCAQDDCSYFGMNNFTKCVDYKPLNLLPQRKWIGLTAEEIAACWPYELGQLEKQFAFNLESKLKEKNT